MDTEVRDPTAAESAIRNTVSLDELHKILTSTANRKDDSAIKSSDAGLARAVKDIRSSIN